MNEHLIKFGDIYMSEINSITPQSLMQPVVDPQLSQPAQKGVMCGRISIPMESFFGNGTNSNQGLIGVISSMVQQVLNVVSTLIGRLFGGQGMGGNQNIYKTTPSFQQQQNGVQGNQFFNQQTPTNDIFGSLINGFFDFGSNLMSTGRSLFGGVGSLFKGIF